MTHRLMAAGLALGLLASATAANGQQATSVPASTGGRTTVSSEAGYTPLFDGKTLSGWESVHVGGPPAKWDVVDGVIEGSGGQAMLYSPKGDYKNFKFRAEVKINDKGNSGMYVRAAKKASFTDGHEIQINATHSDYIRTGSLYTLVHLTKSVVPPDTWFTEEVEVADINYRGKMVTRFRVYVNGEQLYEYLDHDRLFKSGHFAFQQHDPGSKISIRKVEVMELPENVK